jgi:nicotinate-nucleotide pyrophosphorylase (carboxylating)
MQFPHAAARNAVTLALAEDAAADDVTTRWSVAPRQWATAAIITRQPGVAAGVPLAAEVYARVGDETQVDESVPDGTRLAAGDVLARITGPAHQTITGERTVLNFLQRLCGIDTLTIGMWPPCAICQSASWTPARPPPDFACWTSTRSLRAAGTTTD